VLSSQQGSDALAPARTMYACLHILHARPFARYSADVIFTIQYGCVGILCACAADMHVIVGGVRAVGLWGVCVEP
jgi:hypothetical protein